MILKFIWNTTHTRTAKKKMKRLSNEEKIILSELKQNKNTKMYSGEKKKTWDPVKLGSNSWL